MLVDNVSDVDDDDSILEENDEDEDVQVLTNYPDSPKWKRKPDA